MGSSNQRVQRSQQRAEMRACTLGCSCITLSSKEPLEIAVPLFAAFMEDEKKKGEGRKSFLGAGATCLVHISVYKRERDDSAAVQWIFCWHEVEMIRRVNSSCRFYFISFTSRKCPSLHKVLIIVQRDETQAQHGQMAVVGVGHQIWRQGLGPSLICGWVCAGARTENREGGSQGCGLAELSVQLSLKDCNSLGESSRTPQAAAIPTVSWSSFCAPGA